ncbi:MAG: hypothetical protein Q8O61_11790 [Nocardioides sp.]|nr:hypothetical protein [Nocardioides sp.]
MFIADGIYGLTVVMAIRLRATPAAAGGVFVSAAAATGVLSLGYGVLNAVY